jgi:hypothetical protein
MYLTACFSSPGVYNLNRFQFHVYHTEGSKPTIFVFPSPYLITLVKSNGGGLKVSSVSS